MSPSYKKRPPVSLCYRGLNNAHAGWKPPLPVALPLHIGKANEQRGIPFAYACGNSQNQPTTENQSASE